MQSTNEIRHHISAVHETRKITNAMELVSSARLKKVMRHIYYNNEYLNTIRSTMKDILLSPHPVDHPFLRTGLKGKRLYVVVASDKGMVGSYNSDVLDFAYNEVTKEPDSMVVTVGIVAGEYFRKHGIEPHKEVFGLSQDPSLINARLLERTIVELYSDKSVRSVYMIYSSFSHGVSEKPVCRRILPLRLSDYTADAQNEPEHEIMYLPDANTVFGQLIPQFLVGQIFGALVQAFASEHFARMNAMHSATENADELLRSLNRQYNMARQTAITQEIAEIAGAAELMNRSE